VRLLSAKEPNKAPILFRGIIPSPALTAPFNFNSAAISAGVYLEYTVPSDLFSSLASFLFQV
jgi:hypothetical protein